MSFERASGILLHPTSLPGPFGIGDMGPAAYRFVDFLVRSGQRLWQVLPLGPTGYGNSPYACFSAIAGNPLLVSPELLVQEGWLQPSDWEAAEEWPQVQAQFPGLVDYSTTIRFKRHIVRTAYSNFKANATLEQTQDFQNYCRREADWLEDYALFAVMLSENQWKSWVDWADVDGFSIAQRDPDAIALCRERYAEAIDYRRFVEFVFARQWMALKAYAAKHDVQLVGDIPIYVAYNSADVWANRDLFYLDKEGLPEQVAGVPPDYFSRTGQLWGNPIYRWDVLKERGYDWWIFRFKHLLNYVDIVRIDHFRAFEAYWSVPGDEDTAMNGDWVLGPGAHFFDTLRDRLGQLPIMAEDLGVITPEVDQLRDQFDFPGMRILQFAFGDTADNPYLPFNYVRNSVVYTGTHDNDTMVGWFYEETGDRGEGISDHARQRVLQYMGYSSEDEIRDGIHWDFNRLALSSVADLSLLPLQDVMGLGRDARMNMPSTTTNNWQWRFTDEMLSPDLEYKLAGLTLAYRRISENVHHERLHLLANPVEEAEPLAAQPS
ncbi:MAG: 4-alpha-glucanotransferase [Cyanobacteria bacterium J06597_1]